jgi:hypothetical protein
VSNLPNLGRKWLIETDAVSLVVDDRYLYAQLPFLGAFPPNKESADRSGDIVNLMQIAMQSGWQAATEQV